MAVAAVAAAEDGDYGDAVDDDVRDYVGAGVEDGPTVAARDNTMDPDFPLCSGQRNVHCSRFVGFANDSEASLQWRAADVDSWWYQRADSQARDDDGGDDGDD